MKIIIDTREKQPYEFSCESATGTLKTGDYSIEGFEDVFTVEKKSIADLVGTCDMKNRDRFRRELERMRSFRFYALVIDGKESDIEAYCRKLYKTQYGAYLAKKKRGIKCRPPRRPESRIPSVIGTVKALTADYNLHPYFTGSREASAQLIEQWAYYFTRDSKNNTNTKKNTVDNPRD